MRAKVQKWGNSLALRIPKTYAAEVGLTQETEVELSLEGSKLVISPVEEPEYSLEELLAQITKDNLHTEIKSGPPVGNEV